MLSQQQCTDLYSKSLAAAVDVKQRSVKAATLKARRAAARELADWMHSMHAATGRTMVTAILKTFWCTSYTIGFPTMLGPPLQQESS